MIPPEYYPTLKLAHVTLAATSVSVFAVRGAAVLAGQRWPMSRPLRVASVVVDTLLLSAGGGLWSLLALNPMRDAWLGTKLLLLLAYIGLGTMALKRSRTPWGRAAAYAAALAVAAAMASIALAHHPLGFLHP